MIRLTIYIVGIFLFWQVGMSQNTVGLISYNQNQALDGYNLIYPHNQPNVFLLNNCGEIVHTWEDDANWRPGNTAYLTKEGNLYKTKRDASVTEDRIWAGGGGALLEIRDWDNNLIWDFEMNDSIHRLHHDFAITDQGTIIALAWELKNADECLAAGRDTSTLARGEMWPDWIFEIDPELDSIIWEWHTWDHLVQEYDSTKANYGVIADSPDKIDVNFGRVDGHPDWMHANSLDYNDELDQILLSVPYFNEVWIIDHTTTTAQAASGSGGFSGKGGDLMYRWGNPITYQQGDSTDQTLFFQHDAHWVDDFLNPFQPNFGQIAVFNNRVGNDYSTANIFDPGWDMYEWRYAKDGNTYAPDDFGVTITHPDTTALWSTGLSSIQVLPNENYLITGGRFGYTFEITPEDEIVWEYITPTMGTARASQGDSLSINDNLTFRLKRYPSDFEGLQDRDLSSKGWIELIPNEGYCDELTPIFELDGNDMFQLYPNPTNQYFVVTWDGMMYVQFDIFDTLGQRIDTFMANGGLKYIDVSTWNPGLYYLSIIEGNNRYTKKVVVK